MEIDAFINKMDTLSSRCVHKENKAKIGKIKRRIVSLRKITDKIFEIIPLVNSEDEIEWLYKRYLEINSTKKR